MTGPRAWRAARDGSVDPARHVVAPDLDVPVLRVPSAVTSFDPNGGPPRQVDVSRVIGR